MRKLIFIFFTSLAVLFIVWLLIIGVDNNFDLQSIRFSLKATMENLTKNTNNNLKEAFDKFTNAVELFETQLGIENQRWLDIPNNDNWFDGLEYIGQCFRYIGSVFFLICRLAISVCVLVFKVLQVIGYIFDFVFNPVTY